MALQNFGIKLVVQGASRFTSDINNVAQSILRYGWQVERAERTVLSLAKAQVSVAEKAYRQSAREVDYLTRSLTHSQSELGYWSVQLQYANQNLTQARAVLAKTKIGTVDYTNALQDVRNALNLQGAVQKKYDDELLMFNSIQSAIPGAMNAEAQAATELAKAEGNLNKVKNSQSTIIGVVANVLSAATGAYGKNLYAATALGTVLQRLGIQMSAAALIADTLKLGFDAISSVAKIAVGAINLVWSVFSKLATVAWDVTKSVTSFVVNGLKKLVSIPFNIIVGGLSGIWESIKRIGEIAIGMNLSNLIWNLGTKLKDVGGMAFEAAADFQLLQIRMRGLIQRELSESGEMPFSKSLGVATERAKELTDWISKLAVKSVFSAESIGNVLSLAMSYDIASKDAQTLTQSIVQFATGMGLSEDHMRRIIENFGQMKAAGKITGTELRDLSRGAFLPVNEILRIMGDNLNLDSKKIGDLRTKLQDMTTAGEISIDQFFKAFVEMAGRDFPNAIESAGKSWKVFRSNLDDFIQSVVGWRVITPTLDLLSERMSGFIAKLMTNDMLKMAEDVGKAIAAIATAVFKFSDGLTPSFLKNMDKFAGGISMISQSIVSLFESGGSAMGDPTKITKFFDGFKAIGLSSENAGKASTYIIGLLNAVKNLSSEPFTKSMKTILTNLGGLIGVAWDEFFAPSFNTLWNNFIGAAPGWWDKYIRPGIDVWVPRILTFFAELWTKHIKPWWDANAIPFMTTLINNLIEGVQQSDLGKGLGEKITFGVVSWMKTNAGPGSQFMRDIQSLLASGLQLAAAAAIQIGLAAITGAGSALQDPANRGNDKVGGEQDLNGGDKQVSPLTEAIRKLREEARRALDEALKELGDWFLTTYPNAAKLADTLGDMADALGSVTSNINSLVKNLAIFAFIMGGIAGGGGGGNGKSGGIKGFIDGMIKFSIIASPLSASIAGLNTAFSGLWTNLGIVSDKVDKIKKDLDTGNIVQAILDFPSTLISIIRIPFDFVYGYIVGWVLWVVKAFKDWYDQLVGHSIIPDTMNEIASVIQTKLDEIIGFIPGKLGEIIGQFQKWASDTGEKARTAASEAYTNFTTGLDSIYTWVSGSFIPAVGGALNRFKEGVISKVSEAAQKAWTGFTDGIKGLATWFDDNVVRPIKTCVLGLGLGDLASGQLGEMLKGFQDTSGPILDWWNEFKSKFHDIVVNVTTNYNDNGSKPKGGGGSNCFVAGTLVYTPDGQRPIENIEVGDNVYLLVGNDLVYAPVAKLIRDKRTDIVRLKFENGKEVVCSDNHDFLTINGWFQAADLKGMYAKSVDGYVLVTDVKYVDQFRNVYNLEIHHEEHTYLVEGFVVHNAVQQKAARGANFVVPDGFNSDNFLLGLTSGERVIVIPKSPALRNMWARKNGIAPYDMMNVTQNRISNTSSVSNRNMNITVNASTAPNDIVRQFGIIKMMGEEG